MTATAPKTPAKKVSKPSKTTTSKPSKKVVKKEVVQAPAPVPTPVPVSTPVEESLPTIEASMLTVLASFTESIKTLTSSLNRLKADFKILEKHVLREAKTMDKVNAKRNKNKGSRAPSGFVKPAAISSELAKLLGVDQGTKMARTDVTKMITSYVKENGLQASDNGRKIVPDAKLKALLNVTDKEEVTYFNLQKFMKHHFVKA